MSASTTPDRVRTDTLQPGDQVRHPYEMTLITISAVPEKLKIDLRFHAPNSADSESGMRVTGTDDKGEIVCVDAAQSYLWYREAQKLSTPVAQESAPLGYATDTTQAPAGEVERLRARVAELEARLTQQRTAQVVAGAQRLLEDIKGHAAGVDLTVYRAEYEHDSMPVGLYTNEAAAREHCEALTRAEYAASVVLAFDWQSDEEDDPDAPWELVVEVDGCDGLPTGYIVTPLIVDAAYDPEAES